MNDNTKLPPHHVQWFETLKRAVKNDDVALMLCLDASTKEPRSVLCVTQFNGEEVQFTPLGHFVPDGNPFDAYLPPLENEDPEASPSQLN